jgi:hypothetical protein
LFAEQRKFETFCVKPQKLVVFWLNLSQKVENSCEQHLVLFSEFSLEKESPFLQALHHWWGVQELVLKLFFPFPRALHHWGTGCINRRGGANQCFLFYVSSIRPTSNLKIEKSPWFSEGKSYFVAFESFKLF